MRAPRLFAGRVARASALAAGVASMAPAARAQQAPVAAGASELATARALGIEGVKLADANNCAQAVSKLERAERIHHAPTTLGRLGECHVQLGALVLGTELLYRVVREPLPADAPPAFVLAKARAQKVLEQALPKIAKLKISVRAPADVRPLVAIDGEPVAPALLEVDRPTDPGTHHIEASAVGYEMIRTTVTLPEGGSESIVLTLEPDPRAPRPAPRAAGPVAGSRAAPAAGATPGPERASRGVSPTRRAMTYGLLGVGVVGVVAGSVLGVLTLSKASGLDEKCPHDWCVSPEARSELDSASRTGRWSTIAFGVGAAALAGGVALVLTAPSAPPAAGARGATFAPGPALRVRAGLASFGVEGAF
jgi:hypothetical protein